MISVQSKYVSKRAVGIEGGGAMFQAADQVCGAIINHFVGD